MKIAVDYDETFTADPVLFKMFIEEALARGHSVSFVTYRTDVVYAGLNEDIRSDAKALGIDIVFTRGKQKRHCHQADVWIDDSPETIVSFTDMQGMLIGCEKNGDTY